MTTTIHTRSLYIAMAFALALLTLIGCTKKDNETAASEAANDALTHIITDLKGREVSVKKDIESVAVTFNLEEYLAVTGEEGIDKLVGFSHKYWKGRRGDAWDTYLAKFPQIGETTDIGYNDSISVETIIALKPDVLIMSAPVNYSFIEPQLDRLSAADIPVVFVDYHSQTVENHQKSTQMLGDLMGKSERAKEIGEFYAKQLAVVEDRLSTLADADKPKVYMEFSRGVNQYGNSWGKKMWGGLIPQVGGINIANDFGEGNQVDVNPELVIAANPDVIIFTGSPQEDITNNVVLGYGTDKQAALKALASYKNRQGWSDLAAVKNNQMSAIYHDLSRHIFDFAGAQMMAKSIHPELFEDVNPEENLRQFFEKYMPIELTGTWYITLADEK